MILISHRGNYDGPNIKLENNPAQITKMINDGFDCEIDVWYINSHFLLGHDGPVYAVKERFLENNKLWCHAKNMSALEKMIKAYPDLTIKQETMIDGEKQLRKNLYNFFDTYYDPEEKLYLGEDFAFSQLWTKIGGKCMALINEYITHVGEYQFTGRLIDEMVAIPTDSIDTSTKK